MKNQLTNRKGSKREREDDGDGSKAETKDSSDNEEESRAGAIRKKIKLDPFASLGKKKKKTKNEAHGIPTPGTTPRSSQNSVREKEDGIELEADGEDEQAVANELVDVGSSSASPAVLITGKKKKKKKSHKPSVSSPLTTCVLLPTAPSTPKIKTNDSVASIESLVTPVKSTSVPSSYVDPYINILESEPTPATPKVIDLSSIATPLPSWAQRSTESVAAVLNQPILNLGSPPSPNVETDGILPGGTSPKKKRKRRKKKKHSLSSTNAPDVEDGSVQDA